MQNTPARIVGTPSRLLLISTDFFEESALRDCLSQREEQCYKIQRIESVGEVELCDLRLMCDAILLDARSPNKTTVKDIERLANKKQETALLCLFKDHQQLWDLEEVIHLVDDYIVEGSLTEGELHTRISHAIRRSQKERALLEEQNLLHALMDNIPDAIYFKDIKSRFIKVNHAMATIYDTKKEGFEGKTDFDLFTNEHAQAAFEDEKRIIETGKPVIGKMEKETLPGGGINWVSTTKLPLKNKKGEIIGTMGISRNISALKEAEDNLARESQLLKTVIKYALAGIFVKDRQGHYLIVNQKHTNYLGASNEKEVIGKTLYDFFDPAEAERISQGDNEIMESGKSVENMIDVRKRPNRGELWLQTSKVPLHDEKGDCIGIVGISLDITEQKKTEALLERERNLLRIILDNVPDRIFVKDTEGHYIASNKKHIQFLGAQNEKEVLGTTLYDHRPKELAEKYQQIDRQIIQESRSLLNIEESRVGTDGKIEWYLISKVPLIDSNKQTIGLVGIARNITAQKKNEEALKNTIKVLNETQLQLIEAEKLKTVGRLAAGVAHEVKNPLSVVMLGIDFLKRQLVEQKKLMSMLEDMQQAVIKANDVVFELLDYSAPHEVNMASQQLNDIIHRELTLMRHNLKEARIKLVDELSDDLPEILIDASKMEQVFINLILNAISAMPHGGTLTIRSRVTQMNATGANVSNKLTELFRVGDEMVVVEVEDSGHGIDPKDKDKVFEPFYSTSSTGKGTGLGLSVTRSIVEMHRGLILLENRKDHQGTCARLYFPTAKNHV